MKNEITINYQQMPAANERFHASGGVCPQTVFVRICKFIARPNLCEPPPAWSRQDVVRNRRQRWQWVQF